MRHPSEETLNDYVDELLPEGEKLDVRRHLDECEECKQTVAEVRELIARASRLAEIEPPRDLLPEIRTRTRRPGFGWMRWVAAAAAIGFVALLAVWQIRSDGVTRVETARGSEPSIETLLADFREAESEYVRATDLLARRLEERRGELEPGVLAVLDSNLAQIDAAIAAVRLVLDPDRADVESRQMLTALYDKKLQILWRASRLSS